MTPWRVRQSLPLLTVGAKIQPIRRGRLPRLENPSTIRGSLLLKAVFHHARSMLWLPHGIDSRLFH